MLGIVLFVLGVVLMIGYFIWFCLGQGRITKPLSIIINIIMVTISVGAFVVCIIVRNLYPLQDPATPEELPEVHTDILESQTDVPGFQYSMPEIQTDVPEGQYGVTETESIVSTFPNDVFESEIELPNQAEMSAIQPDRVETEVSETPFAEVRTDTEESLQDINEYILPNRP